MLLSLYFVFTMISFPMLLRIKDEISLLDFFGILISGWFWCPIFLIVGLFEWASDVIIWGNKDA